jgi:transcriptional regulator with XRE-family HTH domain
MIRAVDQTFDPTQPPAADQVKNARLAAGLTQEHAAQLAGLSSSRGHVSWAEYENGARTIDAARWELFLLKTGLHPKLELRERSNG